MRITPLDVRKQEFRRSVRGLDPDEVHAFLATVADEYEAVLTDNKQLREKVIELDEKVTEYRNMERTLRDTLITAERVMTEARQNARKEAELILRDAELKAQQQTANIAAQVEALRTQLRELRGHRDSYIARLQSLSEAQIGLVESYRRDFDNEDHAARPLMNADGPSTAAATTLGASGELVSPPPANSDLPLPDGPREEPAPDDAFGFSAPLGDSHETAHHSDPGGALGGPTPLDPVPHERAERDDWRSYSLDAGHVEADMAAAPEVPAGVVPTEPAVAPASSIPAPPVDTYVDHIPEPGAANGAVDEVARAMAESTHEGDHAAFAPGGQPETPVATYGAPETEPEFELPWTSDSSDPVHPGSEVEPGEAETVGEAADGEGGSRWSLSRFTKGLSNF